MPHPACLPIEDLLRECSETRTRRGGPGGQHRNKVETAVVLVHEPTGVVAEASERRSQAENRRVAVRRLRLLLAVGHRERPAAGPSDLWRSRVRSGRISISVDHDDFPAVVAEALDTLAAANFSLRDAAARLGVSGSQLTRLLRRDAAAWTQLNRLRVQAGLGPLV